MTTLSDLFLRSSFRHGVDRNAVLSAGGDRLHLRDPTYTVDGNDDIDWTGFTVEEESGSSLSIAGTKINIGATGIYAITLRLEVFDWLDSTKISSDIYSHIGPFDIVDEFLKSDVASNYTLSATWQFDEGDFLKIYPSANGNSPMSVATRLLAVRLG